MPPREDKALHYVKQVHCARLGLVDSSLPKNLAAPTPPLAPRSLCNSFLPYPASVSLRLLRDGVKRPHCNWDWLINIQQLDVPFS